MPNRTVYLPEDLDAASRRLNLNLSRLVQDAIRQIASPLDPAEARKRASAATARAEALGIDWSDHSLSSTRSEANER